VCVSMCMIAR